MQKLTVESLREYLLNATPKDLEAPNREEVRKRFIESYEERKRIANLISTSANSCFLNSL